MQLQKMSTRHAQDNMHIVSNKSKRQKVLTDNQIQNLPYIYL